MVLVDTQLRHQLCSCRQLHTQGLSYCKKKIHFVHNYATCFGHYGHHSTLVRY